MAQENIGIRIDGMSCSGCEENIKRKVSSMPGVSKVTASFAKGLVQVAYDPQKITPEAITQAIESLGFTRGADTAAKTAHMTDEARQNLLIALGTAAVILTVGYFGGFSFLNNFTTARAGMGFAALFVIGLFTSVHCAGMCGGICLSQSVPKAGAAGGARAAALPSLLYNLGRVTSYTIVGGIVGALGSVIAFTGVFRGAVAILAGLFMVIIGLNMLHVFPWLSKLTLKMPGVFTRGINKQRSAYLVGLLNGLIPCGPLQAMQLYALSTGSALAGAASMFFFSLGTVPLMFGLGIAGSLLTRKFRGSMMAVSAALVAILGVSMLTNGLSLSGLTPVNAPALTAVSVTAVPAAAVDTVLPVVSAPSPAAVPAAAAQEVAIDITANSYAPITVRKGIPVRWIVRAAPGTLNGCNETLIMPAFGIEKALVPGDNIIEFTPDKTGVIPYSCWMGMIRSTITVVE
jgi:uncharacterized protein